MKHKPFILGLLYSFFFLAGSVYGVGEKTLSLGAAASWNFMEKRQGISEVSYIRPQPVLVLAGGLPMEALYQPADESSLDLHLSFDEGRPIHFADSQGHYDVFVSPELASVSDPLSRVGTGAVLFNRKFNGRTGVNGLEGPLVLKPRPTALFAQGSHIRDFSIEFWLYPQNLENGEQILYWYSSKPDNTGAYYNQRIQCIASRSRLQWTFSDIFFSPGERDRKSMSFSGPVLLNRTWSHHLIRFDADLGLLEYLVDGRLEALDYTSSSGREGGEVYTPVIGDDCRLVLGGHFSGMMDEFRFYSSYLEKAVLTRYSGHNGRVESRSLDLGYANSQVLKIEAFGGRTSNLAGKVRNEYAGSSALRFADHSEVKFSFRISNSPYSWNDIPWVPFKPGAELPEFLGRYIQIAADFYPSGDGETSPYLSELKVIYKAAEPPPPPSQVIVAAKDGAVELSWRTSPSRDVGGYYVYYGTAKGEYFEANSPIDVGNNTSVLIDGLNNGTLYYFSVAAYNRTGLEPGKDIFIPELGEFSREVAARPLRMPN